jgi:hypothetical protein
MLDAIVVYTGIHKAFDGHAAIWSPQVVTQANLEADQIVLNIE